MPTSTTIDPVLYLKGLAILNPQYIAGPVHTTEELEKALSGTAVRGDATYISTISTTSYGKAVDTQWLTAEYYRRASSTKLRSAREASREAVAGRYSGSNYSNAVAQAKVNSTQAAAVQAQIADFENTIRNSASPTTGGEWTWGAGTASGVSSGGSGVGSGGVSPSMPPRRPLPGECYFIQCLTTEQPRFFRAIVPSSAMSVALAKPAEPVNARSQVLLEFDLGGVAAPASSRQVIHLGNVRPGESRAATVGIKIVGADKGTFAVFASGTVKVRVSPDAGMPDNVFSLKRGYPPDRIAIETSIPPVPLKAGETRPADRIWIMQGGAIVGELYLTYDVYPMDTITATLGSGRLASGFGEEWGPVYCLCTGLPPLGFEFATMTYTMNNLTTDHARTCVSGWTKCTPFDGASDDGKCVKFQAQGHEKRDRPFDNDVGIIGIDFEASLTVAFRLSRPKPRWVLPTEIDSSN